MYSDQRQPGPLEKFLSSWLAFAALYMALRVIIAVPYNILFGTLGAPRMKIIDPVGGAIAGIATVAAMEADTVVSNL